jgi:hypothetical protein
MLLDSEVAANGPKRCSQLRHLRGFFGRILWNGTERPLRAQLEAAAGCVRLPPLRMHGAGRGYVGGIAAFFLGSLAVNRWQCTLATRSIPGLAALLDSFKVIRVSCAK